MLLSQNLDLVLFHDTYYTSTQEEKNVGPYWVSELFFTAKAEYCKATTNVFCERGQRSLRLGDSNLAKYELSTQHHCTDQHTS